MFWQQENKIDVTTDEAYIIGELSHDPDLRTMKTGPKLLQEYWGTPVH